jgi:inward rectifier potassium channel
MEAGGRAVSGGPERHMMVQAEGMRSSPRDDLYHRLLVQSWGRLLAAAGLAYLGMNLIFGALYHLGDAPIANADPNSFTDAFFFSVQAFSTIGFGSMYPQTTYGHVLVTVQTFLGLLAVATMTGLIFAKFSLPTAKVRFSEKLVVGPHDGVPTLAFRMANVRQNQIVEATVSVVMLIDDVTAEGRPFRRILDVDLVRSRTPTFTMGWVVLHPIVDGSPLFGKTASDLEAWDAGFQITLSGLDGTVSQQIHARHAYHHTEIAWNHRLVDVVEKQPNGTRLIDMRRFDDVVPLETEEREGS